MNADGQTHSTTKNFNPDGTRRNNLNYEGQRKQYYIPLPSEIEEMTAQIRDKWTDKERKKRYVGPTSNRFLSTFKAHINEIL